MNRATDAAQLISATSSGRRGSPCSLGRRLILAPSCRAVALISVVFCWLAAQPALAQVQITQSVTFTSKNQSLFQQGQATTSQYQYFLGGQWGQNTPVPLNVNFGDPINGNGFQLTGTTSGRLGVQNTLTLNSGGVDTQLSYDLKLQVPTYDQLKTGTFDVSFLAPQLKTANAASSLAARAPSLTFTSDLVVDVHADLSGRAALSSLWGDPYSGSFDTRIDAVAPPIRLVSFNAPINPPTNNTLDATLSLLPSIDQLKRVKATAKLLNELDSLDNAHDAAKTTLDALQFKAGFTSEPILSAGFQLPKIVLTPQSAASNNLKSSGFDKFAELRVDVTSLASTILQPFGVPPMSAKASVDFVAGSISAKASLINAALTPRLELEQTETLNASQIVASFDFGRQVNVAIVGINDPAPPDSAYSMQQQVTLTGGQVIKFKDGASPADILLQPTFAVQPTLKTDFGLRLGMSASLELLKGKISGDLLGFDLPSFQLGPAFSQVYDAGSTPVGPPFYTTSFVLDGFNTVKGTPMVLTLRPFNWTGGSGTQSMFDAGNYLDPNGNQPAAMTGNSIVISPTTAITVLADRTNTTPKLRQVDNLTVRGGSQVEVTPDDPAPAMGDQVAFTVTGDIELAVSPGRPGLLIDDKATTLLTNTVGTKTLWTLSGPGTTRLAGADALLKATESLTLSTAAIDGLGTVDVGKTLKLNESLVLAGVQLQNSTGNTLTLKGRELQFVGSGGASSVLAAEAGATLNVQTSAGQGISRVGGTTDNRLLVIAKPGGTVSLDVSSIDSAQFGMTGQTGKIVLARDMSLTNVVISQDGAVESSKKLDLAAGTLLNNGQLLAKGGVGMDVTATASLMFDGAGTLKLDSTKLKVAAGSTVNGPSHTIAGLGTGAKIESLPAADSFINQGRLYAGGAGLELTGGAFRNDGLLEAASGNLQMTGAANLLNLSAAGDLTLTGGRYRLSDGAATIAMLSPNASTDFVNRAQLELIGDRGAAPGSGLSINGTDLSNMTSFTNDATSAVLGRIVLGADRKFLTNKLINKGLLMLQGTSEIGKVSNETAASVVEATIASSGEVTNSAVQLFVDGGTATNTGILRAVKNYDMPGSVTLSVKSGAGAANFRNDGIVQLRNASMAFQGLTVNHGNGDTFEGGKWSVEGAQKYNNQGGLAIDNTTTLALNLPTPLDPMTQTATPPTKLGASVTLIGAVSHVTLNGVQLEDTISQITGAGTLALQARTMQMANNLTNNGTLVLGDFSAIVDDTPAQLVLKAPALNSVGLVNNGLISGAGVINAQGGNLTNAANGQITAVDGELLFYNATVKNMNTIEAVGFDTNSDIGSGAIGLEQSIIDGGTINVRVDGFLVGNGQLTRSTLINNDGMVVTRPGLGVIAGVNRPPLEVDVRAGMASNIINRGEMVATNGGTLILNAPFLGGHVDNQGMLVILPTPAGSQADQYDNGKIELTNVTIDGGSLAARGVFTATVFPNFGQNGVRQLDPKNAWISGRNAKLDNVIVNVDSTIVVADPIDPLTGQPNGGVTFELAPRAGGDAVIQDSYLMALNGGSLVLSSIAGGQYRLSGSKVMAFPGSTIDFNGATIQGGQLLAEGGEMHVVANSRFVNMASEATVTIDADQTLELAKVFHNENELEGWATNPAAPQQSVTGRNPGKITVTGLLHLDGTSPIGGDFNIPSGCDVIGGTVDVQATGRVFMDGTARILGADLINHGTIQLDGTNKLTVNHSTDSATSAEKFTNDGNLLVFDGATLSVLNQKMANGGIVEVQQSGHISLDTPAAGAGVFEQTLATARTTVRDSAVISAQFKLMGGLLNGDGTIDGRLTQTGGTLEPGNSPGTFHTGAYDLSGGLLNLEVQSLSVFDRVVAVNDINLMPGGEVRLDLSGVTGADLTSMNMMQTVAFDVFDASSITETGVTFNIVGTSVFRFQEFRPATGEIVLVQVPEPSTLALLGVGIAAIAFGRRRRPARRSLPQGARNVVA